MVRIRGFLGQCKPSLEQLGRHQYLHQKSFWESLVPNTAFTDATILRKFKFLIEECILETRGDLGIFHKNVYQDDVDLVQQSRYQKDFPTKWPPTQKCITLC